MMPQGQLKDENGNTVWPFNICTEFDCNEEFANKNDCQCGGDFTTRPCLFYGEHIELNNPTPGGIEGDG